MRFLVISQSNIPIIKIKVHVPFSAGEAGVPYISDNGSEMYL